MKRSRFTARFSAALAILMVSASSAVPLEHIVRRGDTLYAIGRTYAVSVDALCEANGIRDAAVLKAGQRLVIPEPLQRTVSQTYVVAPDDTLFGLARKFGVSVDDLKRINNFSADTLNAGQSIQVPLPPPAPGALALRLADLTVPAKSVRQGDTSLRWPVPSPLAVNYLDGKMSGVQLETPRTENVASLSAGTVMYSGAYRGYGQVVFVKDSGGCVYVYMDLTDVAVQKGDSVQPGTTLAKTGIDSITGKSGLIFMVYRGGKPLDPASAPRG